MSFWRFLAARPSVVALALLTAISGFPAAARAGASRVVIRKTPNEGVQPQASVDAKGTLHLIYFKGDPAAGDLYYVRGEPNLKHLSEPIRVNSQPGSAIAIGSIRGGQLALGKDGRVHVAWNGSGRALPKNAAKGTPMLYARLNDNGTAFEPQRNLMQSTDVLDGGGAIAADAAGNVYVAWHALKIASPRGEINRQVWLVHSADNGKTFGKEAVANPNPTGCCGCCGMRAFVDRQGAIHLMYRAATEGVHRDMILLSSADGPGRFVSQVLHPWRIDACPMSSEAFAESSGSLWAAWETKDQVFFARVKGGSATPGKPVAATGSGQERKHPALAANARGEVILVWTEGTGWQRGGALAWQVYDAAGRPTAERGRIAGAIPVWGLATVIADKNTFTILH
jgi:hypothetical protein